MNGYVSPTPYSERAGYTGIRSGYLERRGSEVWLLVATGAGGLTGYRPGLYLLASTTTSNLLPRAGVRGPEGTWVISPEDVLVDYLLGYAGAPVVLCGYRKAPIDWLDSPDNPDRAALQFQALDTTTGDVRGYVRAEACADPTGGFSIEATGSATVTAKDVTVDGSDGKVTLQSQGTVAAAARSGDPVKVTIGADILGGATIVQLAVALLATGGFTPSGVPGTPAPTPPVADINITGTITSGSENVDIG